MLVTSLMLLTASLSNDVLALCSVSPGTLTASVTEACAGQSVTLSYSGTGGDGTRDYRWQQSTNGTTWTNIGATISGTGAGATITVSPTVNTSYRLYVRCDGGDDTGYSNVIQVTIVQPVANAGSNQNVCVGGSVNIGAGSPASGTSYSWQLLSGPSPAEVSINSPGSLLTGVDFTANADPGTYQFELTASCGSSTDVSTVNITVTDIPPVVDVGNDDAISCGSSTTIGTNNSAGISFQWIADPFSEQGSIADPTSEITTVNPSVTTTYTLTAYGCVTSVSDDVTITVNPAAVDAGPDKTIVCGEEVGLEGAYPNGGPGGTATVYAENFDSCGEGSVSCSGWTMSGGYSANFENFQYDFSGGCTSGKAAFANIWPSDPTAYMTATSSLFTSNGGEVTVSYTNVSASGVFSYSALPANAIIYTVEWSNDGSSWSQVHTYSNATNANCSNPVSFTFTPPADDDVYLRIKIQSNNGTDKYAHIDNMVITQEVAGATYSWSGGSIVSGGTTLTPIVNPDATPGATLDANGYEDVVYTLTVVDAANGCSGSDQVTVKVKHITPNAIAGANDVISCGSSVTIGDNGSVGKSFEWTAVPQSQEQYIADPTAKETTATPTSAVTYTLTAYGCTEFDTDVASVVIDMENLPGISAGLDKDINCNEVVILDGSYTNDVHVPGFSLFENFDGCSGTNCSGWTVSGGWSSASYLGFNASSGVACSHPAANSNVYSGAPDSYLTSNNNLFTSNGMPVTISFQYGTSEYSSVAAVAAGSVTFNLQWSNNNGSSWTTIASFDNATDLSCANIANYSFTPPANDDVRIRIHAHRNTGDVRVFLDDISIEQPDFGPTYSWSGGPIVADGNTLTPTVNPEVDTEYTLTVTETDGCSGTATVWVNVEVVTVPEALAGADQNSACGEVITIGDSDSYGATFEWTADPVSQQGSISSPFSKMTTVAPTETTTYTLKAYDCDGVVFDDASVTITVGGLDGISAGNNETITCGDEATLSGSYPGALNSPANSYSQNFDACNGPNCAGWSINGGSTAIIGAGLTCGTSGSASDQIDDTTPDSYITSGTLFTSNGMPVTIDFIHAAGDASLNALPVGAATFTVQWSNNGVHWYDVASFDNINELTCTPASYSFTPVAGNDVRIRFHVHRNSDVVRFLIDEIVLAQAANQTTYSWSGGPIASGGNTLTPSVNPFEETEYTLTVTNANGCTGTSTVLVEVESIVVDAGNDFSITCGDEVELEATADDVNINAPGFYLFEDFDGCNSSSCNGWTVSGGYDPGINNFFACGNSAASDNPWDSEPDSYVTSGNLFTSNGNEVSVSFDFKSAENFFGWVYAYANNMTVKVEWSNDNSNWITIGTFNNEAHTNCIPKSYTFIPPQGDDVYVRFHVHHNTTVDWFDYYAIDNIEIEQEGILEVTEYSWSGPAIVSGGDTATPTVAPQSGDSPATYTLTVTQPNGCIGTDEVVVTVDPISAAVETVVACDDYEWNGVVYEEDGIYTFLEEVVGGCDILHTLDLTINESTSELVEVDVCDEYTWGDGDEEGMSGSGITYTQTGTFTWVGTNLDGCDHVMTLDLIIRESTESIDVVNAYAGSYTWIDGNTYTENNYTATYETQNVAGCDSTITLNLTFGVCEPPTLVVDGTTKNSASLSWLANPDAVGYQIRYKKQGAAVNWTIIDNIPAEATSYTITGLHYETDYYTQIRTFCVNSVDYGSWMPIQVSVPNGNGKFSTLPLEPCDYPPGGLWQENPQLTSFEIHWDEVDDVSAYNLRYKVAGMATPWNHIVVDQNTTSYTLTGLSVNTDYNVQIRTMCVSDDDYSVLWRTVVMMSTLDYSSCHEPPELEAGEVTHNKALITWEPIPGAAEYDIRYKKAQVGGWMHVFVDGSESSVWLTGLATGVPYYVQGSTRCVGSNLFGNRAPAIVVVPIAQPGGGGLAKYEDEITSDEVKVNDEISVSGDMEVVMYPNPTSGVLNIDVVLNDMIEYGDIQIHVYDMSGRIVSNTPSHLDSGFNNVRLNLGELTTGLYSVVLYKDEVAIHRGKVQKH